MDVELGRTGGREACDGTRLYERRSGKALTDSVVSAPIRREFNVEFR